MFDDANIAGQINLKDSKIYFNLFSSFWFKLSLGIYCLVCVLNKDI